MDAATFNRRVGERDLVVAVVGLGYVGLPLAITFAEAGFTTVGHDVSSRIVDGLNAATSHIEDVANSRLAPVRANNTFRASSDPATLGQANVIFICVPTPFDKAKTPDLSYVKSATESAAAHLQAGTLVILQSTTYPGTTTEFVKPILESIGGGSRLSSCVLARTC